MSRLCRGMRSNKRCKCKRFKKREKDEKCTCHHTAELHNDEAKSHSLDKSMPSFSNSVTSSPKNSPTPSNKALTVQDIVAKYQGYFPNTQGKGSKENASEGMARQEMSMGFRKNTVSQLVIHVNCANIDQIGPEYL